MNSPCNYLCVPGSTTASRFSTPPVLSFAPYFVRTYKVFPKLISLFVDVVVLKNHKYIPVWSIMAEGSSWSFLKRTSVSDAKKPSKYLK
jgi:hypothetical protein